MAASQLHFNRLNARQSNFTFTRPRFSRICSSSNKYTLTLLPGDGIGPEVISVAKTALQLFASIEGFGVNFKKMPMGGAALDLTGVPLPEETLGAIGGRAGLKVFANLRPATVLPQLVDASTLKKEVAEGVDFMVVRELTGGFYAVEEEGY